MQKKVPIEPKEPQKRKRKVSSDKYNQSKKDNHQYKCGETECGKFYHSYTAFYNHCKKSHNGSFPENSLYNGSIFEGPSKNRGRPRIKKTEAKDQAQIQSLKTQNELIQFLGVLPKKKKGEEIIIYVPKPIDNLYQAIKMVESWTKSQQFFFEQLIKLNRIVTENDLPDFYDPIEISSYDDKVDSYNFTNVYNYLQRVAMTSKRSKSVYDARIMRRSLIIWLTRNISIPVLAEIIYLIFQIERAYPEHTNVTAGTPSLKFHQIQYLQGKSLKFKTIFQKYFQCIENQHLQQKSDKNLSYNDEQQNQQNSDLDYIKQEHQHNIDSIDILN